MNKEYIWKCITIYFPEMGVNMNEAFKNTLTGIPLITNLVNAIAKFHPGFYEIKDELTKWLAENHPWCYYNKEESCLFVMTDVGQVSFHIVYDEDEEEDQHFLNRTNDFPIEWDGKKKQEIADQILIERFNF